jgi:opacity protein-like surface antigen
MKKIQNLLTLAALAFCINIVQAGDDQSMGTTQTALAPDSDAGFYVAGYGGANFNQHYGSQKIVESDPGFPVDTIKGGGTDSIGATGGLKVGYDFDSFDLSGDFRLQPAVEIEGLYLGSYQKQTYPGTINYVPNNFRSQYNDAALMVNGIVRVPTGTLVTPYVGLGIGGEYISNNSVTVYAPTFPLEAPLGGDSCIVPAVQGLAGVDFKIINGWSVFTEYKYLAAIAPNLSNSGNVAGGYYTAKFEPGWIGQQLITAGIKYSF